MGLMVLGGGRGPPYGVARLGIHRGGGGGARFLPRSSPEAPRRGTSSSPRSAQRPACCSEDVVLGPSPSHQNSSVGLFGFTWRPSGLALQKRTDHTVKPQGDAQSDTSTRHGIVEVLPAPTPLFGPTQERVWGEGFFCPSQVKVWRIWFVTIDAFVSLPNFERAIGGPSFL